MTRARKEDQGKVRASNLARFRRADMTGRHQSLDEGATAVEYALMVVLITLAIVGSVTAFGLAVNDLFDFPWP
jgi:hypothetical protein